MTASNGEDRGGRSGRGRRSTPPSRPDRGSDTGVARPVKRSLSGSAPPPVRRRRGEGDASHVRRPDLPRDRPEIPRGLRREIARTARPQDVDDVAAAVILAGTALEEGDGDRALDLLQWAKSRATRAIAIREALGITHYLRGEWADAQRELLTYRRLSGRLDQNHLLADASRALGHHDKAVAYVEDMASGFDAGSVLLERYAEGLLVLAGMRADRGQMAAALRTLERAPLPDDSVGTTHARIWYAAGDIAERMGDTERAREYFDAVLAVDEEFMDAAQRRTALDGRGR